MNLALEKSTRKEFWTYMEKSFVFSSMTYANKAKRLLLRANIQSKLIKLTADDDGGCVHGVSVSEIDYYDSVRIFREAGLEYKVYGMKYGLP